MQRIISLVYLILFCHLVTDAQRATDYAAHRDTTSKDSSENQTLVMYGGTALVGPRAFNKMTADLYGYALSGSNNPSTGIKISTTSPSASYTGTIFVTPYNILTYTLSATSLDNITQVFSNKKINSSFKFSVGYNFQLPFLNHSYAWYNPEENALIAKRQRSFSIERRKLYTILDSAVVIKHLLNDSLIDFNSLRQSILEEIDSLITHSKETDVDYSQYRNFYYNPRNRRYYQTPIDSRDSLNPRSPCIPKHSDGINLNKKENLSAYITKMTLSIMRYAIYLAKDTLPDDCIFHEYQYQFGDKYCKKLGDLYSRIKDISTVDKHGVPKTLIDKTDDIEIDGTNEFWKSKVISWSNISFSGVNYSATFYDTSVSSFDKRLIDTNALLFSGGFTYNRLVKYDAPSAFTFLTAGFVINGISTLDDIGKTKFAYAKNTFVDSNSSSLVQSTQSGTAYRGKLKTFTGFQLFAEYYLRPWKNPFVPGIYTRLEADYGYIWINKFVLSPTIGAILNITNADKSDTKNYLTIIPYVSMTNIFRSYNNAQKLPSQEVKPGAKIFVGIKVGVPIYFK